MSRLRTVGWYALALISLLPWLALLAAGGVWLWEQAYYQPWLWLLVSCSGIAWIGSRALYRKHAAAYRPASALPAGLALSPRDQAVLAEVEKLADQYRETPDLPLDRLDGWLAMAKAVVGQVARHYRPEAEQPELDVPLTWLFLICERVLRDVRGVLVEKIPGSHLLTLQDGLRLGRWYDRITDATLFFRLARFLTNPLGGVLSEGSNVLLGKVSDRTLQHFQQVAVHYFVNRVGLYAVELYSGRLTVADAALAPTVCSPCTPTPEPVAVEPLRLLVCGQTKAGKSTLVNALCATLCASVDVIPCTGQIQSYRLRREDLEGVILDTPGYGETVSWLHEDAATLDTVDLILLVTSAGGAARKADRDFLDTIRAYFAARPQRLPPPILVVLTHIDQLRPTREWQPPYDLDHPANAKARSIHAAVAAVREDLALNEEISIVPVKTNEEATEPVYNLDALWLAITAHLPKAMQAQLLRCQTYLLNGEKYAQLLRQLRQGSRWLLDEIKARLP